MFEFLLALSVSLVLLAIGLYRADAGLCVLLTGLAGLAGSLFIAISAKALFLIYPALAIAWVVCRWRGASRRTFAGWAVLAVGAAWGVALGMFVPRWSEIQRLAADHPVADMKERLAYERRREVAASDASEGRSESFPSERDVEDAKGSYYHWSDKRASALASLGRTHDRFAAAFAEQEEFGFVRMIHMPPTDEHIRLPEPAPIELALEPPNSTSAGAAEPAAPVGDVRPLQEFHRRQSVDFVNPRGFGLALDGDWEIYGRINAARVRGFQPHAFRNVPDPPPAGDDWQLTKLELVSLLKHDPPAVYVSEHLPRMQELSSDSAPTRPLDAFEAASLIRLREGRTVVAEESRNRISMLGGLRAAAQCTQCHQVREGQLLGAFSYKFVRREPLPPPKDELAPKLVL